jgi:hypothetical protein
MDVMSDSAVVEKMAQLPTRPWDFVAWIIPQTHGEEANPKSQKIKLVKSITKIK